MTQYIKVEGSGRKVLVRAKPSEVGRKPKPQKTSEWYIDWTSFPTLLGNFIARYPKDGNSDFKYIPVAEIVRFCVREYQCSHQSIRNKLKLFVATRPYMRLVDNRSPKSGPFSPPRRRKFLVVNTYRQ
jgi:hypothetical protein